MGPRHRGSDWVVENGSDVEVAELRYSSDRKLTSWVIAVPEDSPVRAPGSRGHLIASELVETTKRYLSRQTHSAKVNTLVATEVKASLPGGRRGGHHRDREQPASEQTRVVDTILLARLIANKQACGSR